MRLQHVTIPIPEGAQDEGRRFYGGVLGLTEKPVPDSRSAAGLVWFEAGGEDLEVHLAPDQIGLVRGARRHVCLVVGDLEAARARVERSGTPITEAPVIPGRPRFYCEDPFGNLVEILTIERDYRAG